MIEIRQDEYGVFFEGETRGAVPPSSTTLGYIERWYEGDTKRPIGIQVADEGLKLPGLIIPGNGISLGPIGFFGVGLQPQLYEEKSALMEGAIVTYASRRESIGDLLEVSAQMPKNMVSIFAETPERVLAAAKTLRLPEGESVFH